MVFNGVNPTKLTLNEDCPWRIAVFILQIDELENTTGTLGVKMTFVSGSEILLQGLKKDVYKAESNVKDMLYKIKDALAEQQHAVMLAQLVCNFGLKDRFMLEACKK